MIISKSLLHNPARWDEIKFYPQNNIRTNGLQRINENNKVILLSNYNLSTVQIVILIVSEGSLIRPAALSAQCRFL
jgi:hypothetical protein